MLYRQAIIDYMKLIASLEFPHDLDDIIMIKRRAVMLYLKNKLLTGNDVVEGEPSWDEYELWNFMRSESDPNSDNYKQLTEVSLTTEEIDQINESQFLNECLPQHRLNPDVAAVCRDILETNNVLDYINQPPMTVAQRKVLQECINDIQLRISQLDPNTTENKPFWHAWFKNESYDKRAAAKIDLLEQAKQALTTLEQSGKSEGLSTVLDRWKNNLTLGEHRTSLAIGAPKSQQVIETAAAKLEAVDNTPRPRN
jgi:hypothetical protein